MIIYEIPGIMLKGFVYSISFKLIMTPQIDISPILQMREIKRSYNLYKGWEAVEHKF